MRGGTRDNVPGTSGQTESGMHADVVRAMGVVGAEAGESVAPFAAFAFGIAASEGEAALRR